MTSMESVPHLDELARQVRASTLQLLAAARDSWLTWAPAGTSNHILWHAGHALWLQDALCIQPLEGASELPKGWEDLFGAHCQPVQATQRWPSRHEIGMLLHAQLERMLGLFQTHAQRLACDPRHSPELWKLAKGVIHGLHDEARHQGEMYLLFKMCRAHNA